MADAAILVLEDGTIFRGRLLGAAGTVVGEAVFNTSMTGYEEILTDPSYYGQIVTMTVSQVGNYGVSGNRFQSDRVQVAGFVVRDHTGVPTHHLSTRSLDQLLREQGTTGIFGIDTRELTLHIREKGAMNACISSELDESAAWERARGAPAMTGANLAQKVSTRAPYDFTETGRYRVAVVDCGIKRGILHNLADRGCALSVFPYDIAFEVLDQFKPDGILFSNGPGDPEPVTETIGLARQVVEKYPVMGICLGHQILSLALGGRTYKLKFGHRGGNHPVKNILADRIEITAQNHGFAVDRESLEGKVELTHLNLNDQTVEGIKMSDRPVFSVQYHPESCPGPSDANDIFDYFLELMRHNATKR